MNLKHVNMNKKLHLSERLAAYSATATAMAALTANVNAQTYSGAKNLSVNSSTAVNVDIDNDGTNDFSFSRSTFAVYTSIKFAYVTRYNQNIGALAGAKGWIVSGNYLAVNENGTAISNSASFVTSPSLLAKYNSGFNGKGDRFVVAELASGKLAWVRVNVTSNSAAMTIKDWAYTTGSSITCGVFTPVLSSASFTNTTTAGTLKVTSDAEGTLYWCVKAASATAPTAAEIVAASGFVVSGNTGISESTSTTVNIAGLSVNNDYKVYYCVLNSLNSSNYSAVGNFSFSTSSSTGIGQVLSTNEIKVYPNPASNYIIVKANAGMKYKIFDISGRIIISGLLGSDESEIDISKLQNGNYIIELCDSQSSMVKKFNVQ
jgi:hypothetical protein